MTEMESQYIGPNTNGGRFALDTVVVVMIIWAVIGNFRETESYRSPHLEF